LRVTSIIFRVVGVIGLLWSIYANQTAYKGAQMIVKCASNPGECHKRGMWKHHRQEMEMDLNLDEPVTREEFEIYDILKSSTMVIFFLSGVVALMGKGAKCAVRCEKAFVARRVFKKSLCAMIPAIILTIVMGKHCKHMHRVIESIKMKHGHQVMDESRGRKLQQQNPFIEVSQMMNEAEKNMEQFMNDP